MNVLGMICELLAIVIAGSAAWHWRAGEIASTARCKKEIQRGGRFVPW